jgi:hypothetical protein
VPPVRPPQGLPRQRARSRHRMLPEDSKDSKVPLWTRRPTRRETGKGHEPGARSSHRAERADREMHGIFGHADWVAEDYSGIITLLHGRRGYRPAFPTRCPGSPPAARTLPAGTRRAGRARTRAYGDRISGRIREWTCLARLHLPRPARIADSLLRELIALCAAPCRRNNGTIGEHRSSRSRLGWL